MKSHCKEKKKDRTNLLHSLTQRSTIVIVPRITLDQNATTAFQRLLFNETFFADFCPLGKRRGKKKDIQKFLRSVNVSIKRSAKASGRSPVSGSSL